MITSDVKTDHVAVSTELILVGRDATGRLFQYWITLDSHHKATAVQLDICTDSITYDSSNPVPNELVPPSVEQAIRDVATTFTGWKIPIQ